MINVVNLTQHYGVRPVLRNVNLTVNCGEMVVLLGPNGMGKTTLMAAIAGVLAPQKGYVEIDGLRRSCFFTCSSSRRWLSSNGLAIGSIQRCLKR